MRITTKSLLAALGIVGVFAAGYFSNGVGRLGDVATSIHAQDGKSSASRRCSNHTLNGAYGVKFEGQKIGTGPFVSISYITFDGDGHYTTVEKGRFNGAPVNRTFTGPYTVNDDCTGFLDFSSNLSNPPHEAHGDFVIVDEGREFFVVDNEDGWAASGVGQKL